LKISIASWLVSKSRKGCRALLLSLFAITAATAAVREADYPLTLSTPPDPHAFTAFATSGWDGNWYVGSNNAWIKKLPPIPEIAIAHVFIGAKLGRMKTLPPVGRPPVFKPVPGEIWAALSSTPAWTKNQQFLLTPTSDIPLEGSAEYAIDHIGEAQWFWVEVPTALLNKEGDNYVAIWSPSPSLVSVSSAPIIASAVGGKETDTWVLNSIQRELPTTPSNPPGNARNYFQPAIAVKLILATTRKRAAPRVRLIAWENGTPESPKPVLTASVVGDSVARAWVEYLAPGQRRGDVVLPLWKKFGRPLWKAPFVFTLAQDELPPGKHKVRVSAVDIWENNGSSDPFEIEVGILKENK